MIFQKMLIPVDGSKNSQIAADYAFWLASNLDSEVTFMHVVDPRLVDLFIEPEFGEELGLTQSVRASEKVFGALRKIGSVILDRFMLEAEHRRISASAHLSEGFIVEEILRRAEQHDLFVLGHRSKDDSPLPSSIKLGSVAESVVSRAVIPTLVAVQPVEHIEEVLVAYDGSEASRGALLVAENLAKNASLKLKALVVVPDREHMVEAKALVKDGESFLREYWSENVFTIEEGSTAETIMNGSSDAAKSILVLGAYGLNSPELNVLGRTTTTIVRACKQTTLIYRPAPVQNLSPGKGAHGKASRNSVAVGDS
ncbi:MAG: universal stress protein [Cyanobacteria bacterium]|nr:universal stress protein [Cyanobacteriota bacterium]